MNVDANQKVKVGCAVMILVLWTIMFVITFVGLIFWVTQ